MKRWLLQTVASVSLGLGLVTALEATAGHLAEPAGEVLLTVTGAIGHANSDEGAALFDRALLEGIGAETVETTTIWTDGLQRFTGVPLQALLEAVGAEGDVLRAMALNDYAIVIPASDAVEGGPIIAYARNGAPMAVRDKGPLWVIYPYDSAPEYQTEQVYARSIWQLVSIEVLP